MFSCFIIQMTMNVLMQKMFVWVGIAPIMPVDTHVHVQMVTAMMVLLNVLVSLEIFISLFSLYSYYVLIPNQLTCLSVCPYLSS